MGRELPGLRDLLCGADRAEIRSDIAVSLHHGSGAGRARLWPDLHHRRRGSGDIPGQALRQHFRHRDACCACRRCGRSLDHGRSARPFRELHDRLCGRHRRERLVGGGDLDGVPRQNPGGRRPVAPDKSPAWPALARLASYGLPTPAAYGLIASAKRRYDPSKVHP